MPKTTPQRKKLYQEPTARVLKGPGALSGVQAEELMHWEEEPGDATYGTDYFVKDHNGVKVRSHNNVRNRRFVKRAMLKLAYDILRGNWKFNMEPIIVGETGMIISGQHRLCALIIAVQMWHDAEEGEWAAWDTEPTIDTILCLGCSEADDVVNTVDTGKPRTLSDVLYRSDYFKKLNANERNKVSHAVGHAIKNLWDRTQPPSDEPPIPRTHSESMQFLEEHPSLLQTISHVMESDNGSEKKLARFLSPGLMSCLMYLMETSTTDPDKFYTDGVEAIDWANQEKAEKFVELLAGNDKGLKPISTAIGKLEGGGSVSERIAILVKGWHCFSSGLKLTAATVTPKYIEEDGFQMLAETPVVGGLDAGFAVE